MDATQRDIDKQAVHEFIQANLDRPIRATEIAQHLGRGKDYTRGLLVEMGILKATPMPDKNKN